MASKTLGYALMLDASPSVGNDISMIIIDGKAFIRESRDGDQFAVNRFSDYAEWVYPTGSNPNIATVHGRTEIDAAEPRIDKIYPFGSWTNITDAIKLANTMIDKSSANIKALILITDGEHNKGKPFPEDVLRSNIPLYVGGWGYRLNENYLKQLAEKTNGGKFYYKPDAYDMQGIFNQILADSKKSTLALNGKNTYVKSSGDFFTQSFNLSDKDSRANLSVVWSDKRYSYTPNSPKNFEINLVLRDPDGQKKSVEPFINNNGSCIFHLDNVKPGKWQLLTQYAVGEGIRGTTGVIDFNSTISSKIVTSNMVSQGEQIDLKLSVFSENNPIENASVQAQVSVPLLSIDDALNRYEKDFKNIEVDKSSENESVELAKLKAFRKAKLQSNGIDIMERKETMANLPMSNDGLYACQIAQTQTKGIYSMEIAINGINPKTGIPFTRLEHHSVFVE